MSRSVPLLLLVMLLVTALAATTSTPLTCRDQTGAAVDWYVLYKLPIIHDTGAPFVDEGVGFMHFSSASTGERWTLSEVPINDSLSAAGRTLEPIYKDPTRKSLIYVFYNDEHPEGPTSFDKGHTKGVVAFDGESGFWLVHSVPKFPPPPGEQYGYPHTGHHFGQSFICLTLNADQVETVAQQLLFNEPYLYATQMSSSLEAQYPLMARVIAGERRSEAPWFGVESLTTSGGNDFTSYAKARDFGKDLYEDLVAPALRTDLLTETWMNGPHDDQMPSNCSLPFHVQNVRHVSVEAERHVSVEAERHVSAEAELAAPGAGRISISFKSSEDHSKWAVSAEAGRPWVCVGDINRMSTQEVRGGGTVCRSGEVIWRLFSQLVTQVEPCPGKAPINVYRRRP